MSELHTILIIAVMAVVTAFLRLFPFAAMGKRKTPSIIIYLGRVLPYAIMGMLIVYCLKDVSFVKAPYGAAEIIAIATVTILHVWKRNTLLSILGGVFCYMALVQLVF
jgi:branched-subunit amino acid transport protein AzlD